MAISRQDRAKQFLPFDALFGFKELLREKEIECEERKELSEERFSELESEFNRVRIGTLVRIKYYCNKQYINISGEVTNIDYNKKIVQIDKKYYISVYDICIFEVL